MNIPWDLHNDDRVTLQAHAEQADSSCDWPAASWKVIEKFDILRWSIPIEFGGLGLTLAEQLIRNEKLASYCLTTTFILSQREAAVR